MWTRKRNMELNPRLAVGGGVSSVELELCCDSHEVKCVLADNKIISFHNTHVA